MEKMTCEEFYKLLGDIKVSVKTYAPSIFKAPLICGAYCSNLPGVSLTTA